MKHLTKPLSEVPVGAHVVHEGEPWKTKALAGTRGFIGLVSGMRETHAKADTRVLHLDGDAPRSLAECFGRDVWSSKAVWPWVPTGGGHWMRESGARRYPRDRDPGHLAWPIVPPQPAADQPQRWVPCRYPDGTWGVDDRSGEADLLTESDARALADHLNATGWQPPAPRLTPLQVVADLADETDSFHDPDTDLDAALAEHGYCVVDVKVLGDAIKWLDRQRWTEGGPADLIYKALGGKP